MGITSIYFFAFVAVSLLVYWLVPHRIRWIILLVDSLLFYFLNATWYTFVYLLASVFSAWGAALYFRKTESVKKKRAVLAAVIVLNVGILGALKYLNMFISTFNTLFKTNAGMVSWLAPLAISYYTLQILSYLIDCYWDKADPEKNPLKLLLFTSFFPLMVSGPICRWSGLSEELFAERRFNTGDTMTALRRIMWGLAKKLVVANNLAVLVSRMYEAVDLYSGIWVLAAAVMFIVQLYFDFSGCMDIVIGVAKCFGISLPENFRAPFLSRSVQEFWQRWHITLGAWLKDYVMFPLSRTRLMRKWSKACKKKLGRSGQQIPYYLAMFVVWTLMGIWHGSSWKYVIGEGWYFFVLIVLGQIFEPVSNKVLAALKIKDGNVFFNAFRVVRTFLLFAIGNIAFRAADLSQMFYIFRRAFVFNGIMPQLSDLHSVIAGLGGMEVCIVMAALLAVQMVCDFRINAGKAPQALFMRANIVVRFVLYALLVFVILFYSASGQAAFVYFQF